MDTRVGGLSQTGGLAKSSAVKDQNFVLMFMKDLPLYSTKLHFVEFLSGYSMLFFSSYLLIFIFNSHDSLCEIVARIFMLVLIAGS